MARGLVEESLTFVDREKAERIQMKCVHVVDMAMVADVVEAEVAVAAVIEAETAIAAVAHRRGHDLLHMDDRDHAHQLEEEIRRLQGRDLSLLLIMMRMMVITMMIVNE